MAKSKWSSRPRLTNPLALGRTTSEYRKPVGYGDHYPLQRNYQGPPPLLPPDVQRDLRHTIAEAMHTPTRERPRNWAMCPLCGHVRSPHSTSLAYSNALTGCCTGEKACTKRRQELDDETIEFLGLVPRESEDKR